MINTFHNIAAYNEYIPVVCFMANAGIDYTSMYALNYPVLNAGISYHDITREYIKMFDGKMSIPVDYDYNVSTYKNDMESFINNFEKSITTKSNRHLDYPNLMSRPTIGRAVASVDNAIFMFATIKKIEYLRDSIDHRDTKNWVYIFDKSVYSRGYVRNMIKTVKTMIPLEFAKEIIIMDTADFDNMFSQKLKVHPSELLPESQMQATAEFIEEVRRDPLLASLL